MFGFVGPEFLDLLIFCRNDLLQGSDFEVFGRNNFLKLFSLSQILFLLKLSSSFFLLQPIPQQHLFQLQINNHLLLKLPLKLLYPLLQFVLLGDLVAMEQQIYFLLQLYIGLLQFFDNNHAFSIYLFFSEDLAL